MIKSAFKPFIDNDSKVLILGTFPSESSLKQHQYYGNKQNQFWRLLFDVFQEPFIDNYDDRLSFLKKHQIALWDVFKNCEREGRLDSKIKNEVVNDFQGLFKKYPNLELLVFSSKNAYNFYKKHVNNFYDKNVLIMPSTSGLYAAMKYEDKLQLWSRIRE